MSLSPHINFDVFILSFCSPRKEQLSLIFSHILTELNGLTWFSSLWTNKNHPPARFFFRRRLGMGARVDQLEAEESKTSTWRKKKAAMKSHWMWRFKDDFIDDWWLLMMIDDYWWLLQWMIHDYWWWLNGHFNWTKPIKMVISGWFNHD